MSIIDQIKAVQSALGITSDGTAGPQTWGAIYKRITGAPDQPGMIGEIKAVQHALGIDSDGNAGPQTWGAVYTTIVGAPPATPAQPGPQLPPSAAGDLDARSERNILSLHPKVQPYARALAEKAAQGGIQIQIISGTRTYDEQAKIYAQGRTAPGKIVTNAKPGHSNHNFGVAFDVGIFVGGQYIDDLEEKGKYDRTLLNRQYAAVGAIGKSIGLDWDGDWTSIHDEPHFELRPAWARSMSEEAMLTALRDRHDTGQDQFA